MDYINHKYVNNLVQCEHCKSLLGYDNNDVFVQEVIYYSMDIGKNDKGVRRLIHCPCCDMNVVIEELKPDTQN